jgi:hypothetical protein
MYVLTARSAIAQVGQWVEIPRRFGTEFNASITGRCLQQGFLRVQPRDGDLPVVVEEKPYIKTAAPVAPRVEREGQQWKLNIRYDG